ncbi:MAG: HD-GYP domain-containing protein [Spirochaetaceae bacterium]|jgi:HD-GYP domain-containing protein (c-di-GMP phosphodiesterase class II)|nr:HD-GYP domain-containing protein [Spirochaetaceae bacterium]
MNQFRVNSIKQGYYFSQPAYLDEGFVVLSQESPFTNELGTILARWGFSVLSSDGEPQIQYSGKVFEDKNTTHVNDTAKINEAELYLTGLEEFTAQLFKRVEEGKSITFSNVAVKVRELYEKIKTERKYLFQFNSSHQNTENSTPERVNAAHAVRSTLISLVIGIYLKLPIHRLIELGAAALVHEIGMAKLPPQVYLSREKLSQKELEVLKLHSSYGFQILKINDFPLAVCAAALEHHERENGAGYPRKLSGDKINFYSKIIAVACSYSAITASRPHQDARAGYEGVTDMLRNEGKQYNDSIVRALVFSISIYPIGQFVELSDGTKGQVVDINPEDPRFPVVQIFSEQTPDGKNKIVETAQNGICITRPLDKDEALAAVKRD